MRLVVFVVSTGGSLGTEAQALLAAAGRHALAHHRERLAEDHAAAEELEEETEVLVFDADEAEAAPKPKPAAKPTMPAMAKRGDETPLRPRWKVIPSSCRPIFS